MDLDTLKETYQRQRLERLKHELRTLLKKFGKRGVLKSKIFSELSKETKCQHNKRDYGLNKMSEVLEVHMKDEVEVFLPDKGKPYIHYRLIEKPGTEPEFGDFNFPELSKEPSRPNTRGSSSSSAGMPRSRSSSSTSESRSFNVDTWNPAAAQPQLVDLTRDLDSDSADENIGNNQLVNNSNIDIERLRKKILQFMIPRMTTGIKLGNFAKFLKRALKEYGVKQKSIHPMIGFIEKHYSSDVRIRRTGSSSPENYTVHLVTTDSNETDLKQRGDGEKETRETSKNAMELMSALSTWGKPATAVTGTNNHLDNVNQNALQNPVRSKSFISLVDDDSGNGDEEKVKEEAALQKNSEPEVIEIKEDSESPKPGPSHVGTGQINPTQSSMPAFYINPLLMPAYQNQISIASQTTMPQSIISQMTSLHIPSQISSASPAVVAANGLATQSNINPFAIDRHDPGLRLSCIDVTTKPVDKQLFEQRTINVRPVYIARGQVPSRDYVNTIAKECIDTLAEAYEYVSQERVEKLLCQRFQCHHIRQLGVGFIDQIPCVNDLNRMIAKINAYILAFVKTRSICTLYEVKECLREYVPNKEDFSQLKLGPLQRFPVVYEQFLFPPDLAVIPEITSMSVLDHFHNYLTRFGLWTKKLELEPFMEYLVKEYSADNAFMLGVRIRSLPLAAGVGII